jgi:GNAT superfamily N-acetyltransferase
MNATSQIRIVEYAEEHRDGVISLILPIQQQEFGVPVTLADQPDLLDVPGYYRKGAGNFWVALDNATVVGTIAMIDIGNGQAALRKMFVARDHRGAGAGVASNLLQQLEGWCATHGVNDIWLGTTELFIGAHRFYEKHGFSKVPVEALPPAFPRMAVDTRFYRKMATR